MCRRAGISSSELELDQLIHEDGFTFVCFRKEGIRVIFSIGASGTLVSAPIVIVGVDRRGVATIADKIRNYLHNPD